MASSMPTVGDAVKALRAWLPARRGAALYVSVLASALIVPAFLDGYSIFLANLALAYVPIAIGLTIILGWTGQFAFTSAAFFGFGAYTGALLGATFNLPVELAIGIGVASCLVLGGALAALTIRLSGYYLSIVTIAFTYFLQFVYENLPAVTRGVAGFAVPAPYLALLGGRTLGSDYERYYVGLALAVVGFAFASWLRTTRLGRAWQALRQSEASAAALGIDVRRAKVAAQAIGAACFGAAGVWFAYLNGQVYPQSFDLHELIFHFLIVVVGGLGSLRGGAIAAVVLVVAAEFFRELTGLAEIGFGLALLLSVLFFRGGLYGTLVRQWPRLREPFA